MARVSRLAKVPLKAAVSGTIGSWAMSAACAPLNQTADLRQEGKSLRLSDFVSIKFSSRASKFYDLKLSSFDKKNMSNYFQYSPGLGISLLYGQLRKVYPQLRFGNGLICGIGSYLLAVGLNSGKESQSQENSVQYLFSYMFFGLVTETCFTVFDWTERMLARQIRKVPLKQQSAKIITHSRFWNIHLSPGESGMAV